MISLATINEIINKTRQRVPDIDDLKKLNVWLKKTDSDVYEALRGANLRQQLNELDINPDLLEKFIELSRKLSFEMGTNAKDYAKAAIRLMNLEQNTNKSYETILQEYEKKQSKNTKLLKENEQLNDQIIKRKEILRNTKQELNAKTSKIKKLVATQKRLKRIGLDKLEHLTQFILDYEALGFDAKNVQELNLLNKKLLELKIKPQKLKEYVSSEIAYKKKISDLNLKAQEWESRVKTLRSFNNDLLKQNISLNAADRILRNKQIPIRCRKCRIILFLRIKTREEYQSMILNGLVTQYPCPACGFQNQFSPYEELAEIARSILPKKEEI